MTAIKTGFGISVGGTPCSTSGAQQQGRTRAMSEPCPLHPALLPFSRLEWVTVWTPQYEILYIARTLHSKSYGNRTGIVQAKKGHTSHGHRTGVV